MIFIELNKWKDGCILEGEMLWLIGSMGQIDIEGISTLACLADRQTGMSQGFLDLSLKDLLQ